MIIIENPSTSEIEMDDEVAQPSKIVLKNLEDIVGKDTYKTIYRKSKTEAYTKGLHFLTLYGLNIIIDLKPTIENRNDPRIISLWKSITMKIVQSFLLHQNFNGHMYTKKRMISEFCKHCSYYEDGLDILFFRKLENEKVGIPNNTINFILKLYKILIDLYVPFPKTFAILQLKNIQNTTHLSDILFYEFINSPIVPTNNFIREWSIANNIERVRVNFIDNLINTDYIPRNIRSKIVYSTPNTDEWKNQLSYYKCGRNSGIIPISPDTPINVKIKKRYNLIRGHIGEDIVVNKIVKNCLRPYLGYYIPITVGFVAENINIENSNGCAPDLLLLVNGILIPVEIKTMICDNSDNNDSRRGIKLASRQVKTCKKLLGGQFSNACIHFIKNIFIPDIIIGLLFDNPIIWGYTLLSMIYSLYKYYITYNLVGIIAFFWTKNNSISFYYI